MTKRDDELEAKIESIVDSRLLKYGLRIAVVCVPSVTAILVAVYNAGIWFFKKWEALQAGWAAFRGIQ